MKKQERSTSVIQDFYAGVTGNPEKRIFDEHNVNKEGGFYMYYEANTIFEAKQALNELISEDMNGLPLNGHVPGKFVYCYYIEGSSKECRSEFE